MRTLYGADPGHLEPCGSGELAPQSHVLSNVTERRRGTEQRPRAGLQRQQSVHRAQVGLPLPYPTPPFLSWDVPLSQLAPFFLLVGHNVKLKQAKDNKFIFFTKVIN